MSLFLLPAPLCYAYLYRNPFHAVNLSRNRSDEKKKEEVNHEIQHANDNPHLPCPTQMTESRLEAPTGAVATTVGSYANTSERVF